ncbi:MAG: BPL-N domain-containing protein [Chthoniobacterales bacterium]
MERKERAKVIGLTQQLETMRLTGGGLRIGGGELGGNADDWQIAFRWAQSPKEKEPSAEGEKTNPDPWPRVSSSAADAEKVRAALLEAAGDSFGDQPGADWHIGTLPGGTKQVAEIVFPDPQTGISKARQFRVARRFVALLMRKLGMRPADEKTFHAGIFEGRVLGNYDAEGVGYGGSTLLDRAVDDTSLDARVLPLCPEDIREGALDGAAGVMFPGGSGKAIAKALRPEGVEKVREFVAAGGGYYGVCAGAYFANSGLPEYAALLPLKHHQPWRKGKGMLKVVLTEEGKKLLGSEFAEFETRYNCGPVFTEMLEPPADSPENKVTVLANFASAVSDKEGTLHNEMVGTPAILSGRWGNGRVITVSPHPESHTELSPLVARAIALSLGLDPASIRIKDGTKQAKPEP